ncbi:MAG: histidinol-phosphatase [Actinomycetia bacterium]|nr:histidinol-phosphatase [Actinomycetes bacterium]MCP4224619.1 histidinol-phosphatase [Actinomycetes bacterium]MCP5033871.1 histidinol-phosphatase [Actinomycetes bacterium]
MAVENKLEQGFDPVTEADRAVEDEIRAGLERRFADHAIMGEEGGETGEGPYRWVIDPIDGTRAFISGQPMWGTLVGFQIEGEPVAGWMHQPVLDETHVATPSGGWLTRNGETRPLGTSRVTELGDAIVLCTHPEMFVTEREREGFGRIDQAARLVRYSGDCVNYGLLAAGHADLVVENQLKPYDIIPLIPIVEAAGGVITDIAGRIPVDGGYVVAAASRELHEAALAMLS